MEIDVDWTMVKTLFGSRPFGKWNVLSFYLERLLDDKRTDWLLPLFASRSLVGELGPATEAAIVASLAAAQASIIVVDSIIDNDDGIHQEVGAGQAANIASYIQASAFRFLSIAGLNTREVVDELAKLMQETAFGQQIVGREFSEENYWELVDAKSVPFYQRAMMLGAEIAGADAGTVLSFGTLGAILGRMVQVRDDLVDIMAVPASADWSQQGNLLLVYANTVDWKGKKKWEGSVTAVLAGKAGALETAQQVLIDIGAVAYALHTLTNLAESGLREIENMGVKNKDLLHWLINEPIQEVESLAA